MPSLFLTPRLAAPIPSAATLLLPATADRFDITGTETITTLQTDARGPGARLYLRFTEGLTLTHGEALALRGGEDFTAAAGDILLFEVTGENQVRQLSPVNGAAAIAAGNFGTAEPEATAGASWLETTAPQVRLHNGHVWFQIPLEAVPTCTPTGRYIVSGSADEGANTIYFTVDNVYWRSLDYNKWLRPAEDGTRWLIVGDGDYDYDAIYQCFSTSPTPPLTGWVVATGSEPVPVIEEECL